MERRRAVYPGSFDPITNGHLDIVRRALSIFDHVIVAVAYNQEKQSGLFTPEERVELIREVTADLDGRLTIDSFHGLLVDYVRSVGANTIVRGLRAVADFDYEFQMALMNRHLAGDVETVFLMADEAHFYTSSRLVKEVVALGGDVSGLVPPPVVRRLEAKLRPPKQ
ncbi:MAG: pantetheine-phosphate adenylyltransferase [Candidatus Dadabacteria bacterium]|nr:MAG: pantetheine-phosphate adenylyltransferase [Candidatus Dadabacteria bacterium]